MHDLIPLFDDHSHPQINRLLNEKALRCPECGAHQGSLLLMSEESVTPRYLVACGECKYQGPLGKTLYDAVTRWNKPMGFIEGLLQRWKKKRAKQLRPAFNLKKQGAQ
jgi:hypothetical protein